jgi:serine/threonine protein phosphatase PrpC
MSFMTESVSRVGGRELNEDSYGFLEMNHAACWVVADGLGGHRGGETASRIAVDAALASFRAAPEFTSAALQRHLDAAQQAVLKAQKDQPTLSTMRTTIVILLTDSKSALWAHVGDSRLYCLDNGRIVFCTKDHSVVQAMVNAGELPASKIRHHEDRNRLLRCLGNSESEFRPTILPEARTLNLGMAFLLCTDGFWENVTEPEMEVDFAKAEGTRDWLALMEGRLLERATDSSDNYTAIAVRYDPDSAASASPGSVSASSSGSKVSPANVARLARICVAGLLLVAIELPILQVGENLYLLEHQVGNLKGERDVLEQVLQRQQHRLEDLQHQLRDAQGKKGGAGGQVAK